MKESKEIRRGMKEGSVDERNEEKGVRVVAMVMKA